jgi:anti-sigma regulatory factor (Ser/Thr protein kinase)
MEVTGAHHRVPVIESSQPSAARFAAKDAAAAAGFAEEDAYRAGLVATELATNLVKHATGGEVLVRGTRSGVAGEVELLAIDRGPGIGNIEQSLTDGHSTAGSAGTGLGAARRLADDFDIYSQPSAGTIVLARVRAGRASTRIPTPLRVAGLSVAKGGEFVCGDSWQIFHRQHGALAMVVDGLGHGLYANVASQAAIDAVDGRGDDGPAALLQLMHERLRHTRGAAGAIADIGVNARVVRYAGIGNISGTISRPGSARHAVSLNGTLGHEARTFREYSYPWDTDALFVMFSDGLGSHWSIDDYRGLRMRDPAIIAAVLYRDFARQRDDVTVVVGREAL